MTCHTTLFDLIPHDLEKIILTYVDDSKKRSIDEYLHNKYFKRCLDLIDRRKLTKYINDRLENTYPATYKYSVGSYHCLAYFHFPMYKDGSLMVTNGRANQLCFKAYCGGGKIFLDISCIKYHRNYNNYTKKQQQKLWLLKKILLTSVNWEK